MSIVSQINDLRVKHVTSSVNEDTNVNNGENETANGGGEESQRKTSVQEKNASALIFVILEICIKDLIKYMPDLLNHGQSQSADAKLNSPPSKSSFLYLHVTQCKQLTSDDVELLKRVLAVLNALPFHSDLKLESIQICYSIHSVFFLFSTI
jgi:hypothetical protein